MYRFIPSGKVAALAAALAVLASVTLPARGRAQTVESVTYTDEQAARGDQLFIKVCQQCHTRRDMASADFRLKWNGQTVYDLYDLVRTTMPDSAPGTLSQAEYSDVTAYILKLNGIRSGAQPMPIDSLMRRIKLDIPATGAPMTASPSVTSSLPFAPRLPMSNRHSFLASTSAAVVAVTLAAPNTAQAQRQSIVPPGMSVSPTLTPGVRIGDAVYSSGQLGMKRDAPDSTVGGQTKVALENVKAVFETAGTSMAQAAKCTVFLVDVKDFAGMNAAYREFFPTSPPARSTVVVAALVVAGAKVEIECVATMPGK